MKVKTLTKNWRDPCRTGTRKCTEPVSKYLDEHGRLSQSEESKCLWTHYKDGTLLFKCAGIIHSAKDSFYTVPSFLNILTIFPENFSLLIDKGYRYFYSNSRDIKFDTFVFHLVFTVYSKWRRGVMLVIVFLVCCRLKDPGFTLRIQIIVFL